MPTFTVHVPPGVADDAARADGTAFVREGFDWPAFLLGPLALLYRGLWLATLAWALVGAALLALAAGFGLAAGPRLLLYLVLAALTGLEAAEARRRALDRRGFILAALLSGVTRGQVERAYFAGLAPLFEPLPQGRAAGRPGARAVIGSFPASPSPRGRG